MRREERESPEMTVQSDTLSCKTTACQKWLSVTRGPKVAPLALSLGDLYRLPCLGLGRCKTLRSSSASRGTDPSIGRDQIASVQQEDIATDHRCCGDDFSVAAPYHPCSGGG